MSVCNAEKRPKKHTRLKNYGDLLTISDLCEITGLSAQTIRAEAGSGRLVGAKKIGRTWYISKKKFAEYWEV